MGESEKKYLKEAICRMIDNGDTWGVFDTMQYVGTTVEGAPDFLRRRWEISINKVTEFSVFQN